MKEFDPNDLLPPQETYGPITPLMIEHLRGTKPWVRLMSVILFISTGFIVVAAIAIVLIPSAMGGLSIVLGLVYFALGMLYLFPAYFLHQYASAIRNLEQGGGDVALEEALRSQKSFWKFVGIMTVIVIGLYIVMIAFMLLGGMMMGR